MNEILDLCDENRELKGLIHPYDEGRRSSNIVQRGHDKDVMYLCARYTIMEFTGKKIAKKYLYILKTSYK